MDEICVMREKPGAFFPLISLWHYIYIRTNIYLSIPVFFFLYIYLLVCSWHRLILRPFIDCRRQRKKKIFFLLLTPLNFWLLLVLKVTTITTTARTKRMRERKKEMTKKIMEKTFDKKKRIHWSHTRISSLNIKMWYISNTSNVTSIYYAPKLCSRKVIIESHLYDRYYSLNLTHIYIDDVDSLFRNSDSNITHTYNRAWENRRLMFIVYM